MSNTTSIPENRLRSKQPSPVFHEYTIRLQLELNLNLACVAATFPRRHSPPRNQESKLDQRRPLENLEDGNSGTSSALEPFPQLDCNQRVHSVMRYGRGSADVRHGNVEQVRGLIETKVAAMREDAS